MNIAKYLNSKKNDSELIWQFAFLGNEKSREEKLAELSKMAEKEKWTSKDSSWNNDILYSYIVHTFNKAAKDNLVIINDSEEYAIFNTGLLTENGEDIICLFNEFRGSDYYHWHLSGFRKESDWDIMNYFNETPEVISYFDDPSKIYFNPNKELVKNLDHILDDNIVRFSSVLQEKGKTYINSLLTYALDLTIKRCQRNYRIAVPQYYMEKITYLLPVVLDGELMSVAVEEVNNRYRVNTIFTVDMAYKNARLLMKPEADWLTPAAK